MKRVKALTIILLTLLMSQWVSAEDLTLEEELDKAPRIMSFKLWKSHQVMEAQNKSARIANQIQFKKTELSKVDIGEEKSEHNFLEADIAKMEKESQQAIERLEITREFGIDEYIAVYFKHFSQDKEALKEFAQRVPPEEMAEIMVILMGQDDKEKKLESASVGASITPNSMNKAFFFKK